MTPVDDTRLNLRRAPLPNGDEGLDGRFVVAVRTADVYCRPICRGAKALARNRERFASAAAARAAGYRPCLRCRPELAPGLGGWGGGDLMVRRVLECVAEHIGTGSAAPAIGRMTGLAGDDLEAMVQRETGAGLADAIATERLHFAKLLASDSGLSPRGIALAAGYRSPARLEAELERVFGRGSAALRSRAAKPATGGEALLRLPYRRPFVWEDVLAFFRPRAIPGVERVDGTTYRRSFRIGGATGRVSVSDDGRKGMLVARVRLSDWRLLGAVRVRLMRLFDVDADPGSIGAVLGADTLLAPLVAAQPGLRMPGAWDGFEMAVRAVLNQQISVAGARTLAGRIAERWGERVPCRGGDGEPALAFPAPRRLMGADLASVGVMGARAATLERVAEALASDPDLLSPYRPVEGTIERLLGLRGIGAWTAQYVAMRALKAPDAFPAADLGILRALRSVEPRATPRSAERRSERWRPWRSYAAGYLWRLAAGSQPAAPGRIAASGARAGTSKGDRPPRQ